jgi:hypothetical protein
MAEMLLSLPGWGWILTQQRRGRWESGEVMLPDPCGHLFPDKAAEVKVFAGIA